MLRNMPRLAVAAAVLVVGASHAFASTKNTVTVTIKNETGYYLVEMNRATDEALQWGGTLLGDGVVIRPSRDRDVAIPAGYAWVRAVFDVDGSDVEVIDEADFENGGEYVWRITEDMLWEASGGAGSGDTYGYYDDTYGYYDDSYGYYGD